MPVVSYVTLLDGYIILSFAWLFASCLESFLAKELLEESTDDLLNLLGAGAPTNPSHPDSIIMQASQHNHSTAMRVRFLVVVTPSCWVDATLWLLPSFESSNRSITG